MVVATCISCLAMAFCSTVADGSFSTASAACITSAANALVPAVATTAPAAPPFASRLCAPSDRVSITSACWACASATAERSERDCAAEDAPDWGCTSDCPAPSTIAAPNPAQFPEPDRPPDPAVAVMACSVTLQNRAGGVHTPLRSCSPSLPQPAGSGQQEIGR